MIAVKGMKMPNSCSECNLATRKTWNYACSINLKDIDCTETKRPKDCPLVEIVTCLSARTMNAGELRDIAKYLGTTDKLTCPDAIRVDAISRIMGKVHTDSAREALLIADKLSDMILFHKTVRENGTEMMKPWKDAW